MPEKTQRDIDNQSHLDARPTRSEDNWAHRSEKMLCPTCMYFVRKGTSKVGRCRRRSPTLSGWPVMFDTDWCGDHKIDEGKV